MADSTEAVPSWWCSLPDEADRVLRGLPGVSVETIGRTAGGRPIAAAFFGEPDHLPGRTSVTPASARAGHDPSAFYGRGKRSRQHVILVGATHGTEFEGTVAMLHVMSAIVTGVDLRGRARPALHALRDRLRVVFVPFLNVDGRMRFPQLRHFHPYDPQVSGRITLGELDDGTIQKWPDVKTVSPQPIDRLRLLGSYFNDAGVNLVYDDFFGEPQPETRALMSLCRREAPDMVLLSHTNRGTLVEPAVSFIPRNYQLKLAQLSGAVAQGCARQGLTRELVSRAEPYCGQVFYQTDALHHHCGALPVLMEFPGCVKEPTLDGTLESILDLSVAALEEVFVFGDTFGYRPTQE